MLVKHVFLDSDTMTNFITEGYSDTDKIFLAEALEKFKAKISW